MNTKAFLKNIKWRQQNLGIKKTDFGTKFKIISYMDHLVFKEIFIDNIYDDFIIKALVKNINMHEPKKIWNLGANLGFFSIRCCEIWLQLKTKKETSFSNL